MPLSPDQRAELEALGPEVVRDKVATQGGTSAGSMMAGFQTRIFRGDIEDWLAGSYRQRAEDQHRVAISTLRWAKIAGWAGIVGSALGAIAIAVSVALALLR